MERIKLQAEIREEIGKNKLKIVRKADYIPACLYRAGKEAFNLKVNKSALHDVLHTKAGENVIIDLTIESQKGKTRPVIMKEVQYHPIKDDVLHIDFNEISLTEKIKVNVPVAAKGEAEEVKKESGIIEHVMWEVEIECLPTQIPEKIEVDVSHLKIGDAIFVKDLVTAPGIEMLSDPESIVINAVPPHIEKPAEEVAPEDATTEPEVIEKGKKEKEGEEEAAEVAAPKKEAKKEAK
ncbi:MAG: 50S ribosomal protein L25 [Candidatus Omnitrophica bacterium]|nr:50S ribosomal protein L25 [Candidatus Omnitrophota bacterium]